MTSNRSTAFIASCLFLGSAFVTSYGQKPPGNFNRPQTFDAQNYTIRASFDPASKKVFGDTIVSLKPLKPDFRIVAQQISGDLWVMNRLVGNAPALEEKIIFVILGSEAASSLPASTASKRNR